MKGECEGERMNGRASERAREREREIVEKSRPPVNVMVCCIFIDFRTRGSSGRFVCRVRGMFSRVANAFRRTSSNLNILFHIRNGFGYDDF